MCIHMVMVVLVVMRMGDGCGDGILVLTWILDMGVIDGCGKG